ncbi:hypothetical protein BHM03_00002402 [Ensete ventricosum]|nr:hypothetical protein BHM03_00002402 [Ensete ventricosum]
MTKDECSGADIKEICSESGLLALKEQRMKVCHIFTCKIVFFYIRLLLDKAFVITLILSAIIIVVLYTFCLGCIHAF